MRGDSSVPRIEISLAEWSLHRAIYGGRLDHLDFAVKARKDFGISAVEYVNGFFGGGKMSFQEAGKNAAYLKELLTRSKDAGVVNHLLMVDDVSAKTYDFDANGEQPLMDYKRLIGLVKASGYKGYIGIEFEGNTQSEEEGIRKTKALLERYL
jgi:hypothetical protein